MKNIKPLTLNLSSIEPQNAELVGSKAANLGKLIRNKFSVPDGFVVTTEAYSQFLKRNNLGEIIKEAFSSVDYDNYETIENCAKIIQNSIEECSFSSETINEIKAKYEHLASKIVAVRSSATAEDLPLASFAGQYDTFLNLKSFDQVLDHIRRCYESLWTSRAIAYRYKNQIPHEKVKLAAIVQKMIPARSAGVLFTINPITLEKSELVIESNFGLGESIVSGKSSPDQFVVQRQGKSGKESFKVLDKRIGNKRYAVVPKSSENEFGVEYIELSEKENEKSSLSDEQIAKLAQIGTQIEKIFGGIPQDIEWAIDQSNQILPLQSRPVTSMRYTLPPDDIIWSRGYSDDYWNDNVTPLYFELLGDQLTKVVNIELNSIMGYKRMDDQLLKLFNAHVYFNLKVLKRKVENEIPSFMRNVDVLNYFPDGSGPFGKNTIKKLPLHIIKRIVAELRVMLFDPNGSMSKTDKAYEKWTQEIFNSYCEEFDTRLQQLIETKNALALVSLAEELDKQMVAHFRLVRYGIPVHNIGMNLLVQYLLTRFIGNEECLQLYPILVSGLEHKLTETNDKIHHLASIIYESPELRSIIIEKKSEEIYNYLLSAKSQSIKNFFNEFEKFIKEHGDRGFTRETFYPRWREPPMTNVFDILKSLVMDQWQELEKIKAKNLHKRESVEKLVEAKIRSQEFGILKWKIFSIILKNSRKYIVFRENQRFNLDHWITRNRNVYLEIGKIFKKQGILLDDNNIFFLRKREIKNLALGKYSNQQIREISSEIKKRYEDFIKYENVLPTKFLLGSREFDDTLQYDSDSTSFRGIPASQGTITAPVHVLHDIDQISTVRAGEIIVVPRTDPGWTPVFSKIGGLITETGGILSHGAVVSREYGIPAVTNIINACKIFKTGQIVKVDGYKGIITLKN